MVIAKNIAEEHQAAGEATALNAERHRRRSSSPRRAITIAGVTPVAAPTWRCQAESQSKVWNGVQSAVCSKRRHSCSMAAKLSWTERLRWAGSARVISVFGTMPAGSRA